MFLPRYGPLRSVFASLRTHQKWKVWDLSFLIGVDCVVVGVSMITLLKILLMKLARPTVMISPSLNPNAKLGGECNIPVPFRTPF